MVVHYGLILSTPLELLYDIGGGGSGQHASGMGLLYDTAGAAMKRTGTFRLLGRGPLIY